MKASRFFGSVVVLTLLMTLSQTIVSDSDTGLSAGTTCTVNAYDIVGNESGQRQGVLGFGESAQGATINAASCEQTDVQAAIDSANSGDIVIIPSGECTWSGSVSIPDAKKITLQGSGYNNTVITRSETAISMNESGSRVTGIGFIQPESGDQIIHVQGTGWRIDHCKFNNTSGNSAVSIHATGYNIVTYPTGLIDNNTFLNGRVLVNGLGTFAKMSGIWAGDLLLGTGDAVYVEDNVFIRNDNAMRNAIDSNRGGKYVFRFNSVTNSHLEAHSLQSSNERATRKWEIYRNTHHLESGVSYYYPYRIRGGTGIIFDNAFTGAWYHIGIALDNVRSYRSIGSSGLCDGSSDWDGNQDATGWPCRDQIGRSTDEWLWTDSNPYPPQESAPAYLWGNDAQDNSIWPAVVINSGGDHIKANRDFYDEVTSFDGASGVGTGTYAQMMAISTCAEGVGFWVTDRGDWNTQGDDGVLYRCDDNNQWIEYYEPYIYPHPLTKELVLHGTPANQAIHLTWTVGGDLPPTSTWQIGYYSQTVTSPLTHTVPLSATRAYTLTGLTNYTWYTVTLNGMLASAPFLTDTVTVMPTDIFVYLPVVWKGQ
jgi:hypothetical protein